MPPSLDAAIADCEALAALVGWTRNYFTHWNPKLERKAAKDDDLVRLTEALRLILEALLLLEVGFAPDEIGALVASNPAVKRDIAYAFGDE
ncbi:MAG: hypothetical protein H0W90_15955 [Actinobacteria bacterium]|nr:hypothetical protein [Actinomycetota bacterium]